MPQEDKGPKLENTEVEVIIAVEEDRMGESEAGHPRAEVPPNVSLDYDVLLDANGNYALKPTNSSSGSHLGGSGKKKDTITFPQGKPWYDVTFHLKIEYLDFDTDQPFAAAPGICCPEYGSGVNSGQLTATKVANNLLTIQNTNQDAGPIGYSLFFVDENGISAPPFDPIMDNQGGGHTLSFA